MHSPNMFPVGDAGEVTVEWDSELLNVTCSGSAAHSFYVAVDDRPGMGSFTAPLEQSWEGSTVFLPMAAKSLFYVIEDSCYRRAWRDYAGWSPREPAPKASFSRLESHRRLSIPVEDSGPLSLVVYVKDLRVNSGWGTLLGCTDPSAIGGTGDRVIGSFLQFSRDSSGSITCERIRGSRSPSRIRIYELFPRLFGNVNTTGKQNGRLAENGCGKFADINEAALSSLVEMNFTHVWLLGVIRHASTTPYQYLGFVPDDSDLMKGLAGSPFAIKDYFDVSPDLAVHPENRLAEFRSLTNRIHSKGLKVILDLVPNHVSRAYRSTVRPDLDFGASDHTSVFFDPSSNFYYLRRDDEGGGPPLRLPTFDRDTHQAISSTCAVQGDCDGLFEGEQSFGRVTGNNRITWTPDITDWYETVKLNYGFDFRGQSSDDRHFPNARAPHLPVPDTWLKLDAVIAFWQSHGADGFRCDMAHMIPPEFWAWAIARAKDRNHDVFFMAEAYNDMLVVPSQDPTVLAHTRASPLVGLLQSGFNAVYGHDTYSVIRQLYMGPKWANDIDEAVGVGFVGSNSVCYAENHDEIRLASPLGWGGLGPRVGRVASAVLYGLQRGPIIFYNGQEVGEPALGASGFSGDDGRTTIFDYWSMPELAKWVNNHRYDGEGLSEEQRDLRSYYSRLLAVSNEPAFRDGHFYGLNPSNLDNPEFGRCDGETVSGHWLYAFLRYDPGTRQRFLVVANFHGRYGLDVNIRVPEGALDFLAVPRGCSMHLKEQLSGMPIEIDVPQGSKQIRIGSILPLTACYFALTVAGLS